MMSAELVLGLHTGNGTSRCSCDEQDLLSTRAIASFQATLTAHLPRPPGVAIRSAHAQCADKGISVVSVVDLLLLVQLDVKSGLSNTTQILPNDIPSPIKLIKLSQDAE